MLGSEWEGKDALSFKPKERGKGMMEIGRSKYRILYPESLPSNFFLEMKH